MNTKLFPPFTVCVRVAILRVIFLAAATHAADPATPQPPAMPVKVECLLLEMTSKQADYVEQMLQRWNANRASQGPELDQLLWGNGAKKITELSVISEPGKKAVTTNYHGQKPLVPRFFPADLLPIAAPFVKYDMGDSLELSAVLDHDAGTCDVNLTFRRQDIMEKFTLETVEFDGGFSILNRLPVLLGRRDFGTTAKVFVARATWAAPISRMRPSVGCPYVRAQLFAVPQALMGEAARVKADPMALAEWLRKRATCLAMATTTIATWLPPSRKPTKERYRFGASSTEKFYKPIGGGIETFYTYGTIFETDSVIAPNGNMTGSTLVHFYRPNRATSLTGNPTVERDFRSVWRADDVKIPVGGEVALPCTECHWKKGTLDNAWPDTVPDDIFVVWQPIWSDGAKPPASATGSTPAPQKPPTPPATPSPAVPPPAGQTPK